MSKRIRSRKALLTRNQLTTNAIGNKKLLIQYWIDSNHIPCQKTQFFKLYNLYKSKCLPDDVQWIDGAGQKPLLSLQEVEKLVTDIQNRSSGRSYSMNDTAKTLNKARDKQLKEKRAVSTK
jgi:hypothetical protein